MEASTVDVTGKLIISNMVGEWCKLPYPDHPQGCPNYGKQAHCPPQAPTVAEFIDLSRPHWFIIVPFNLEAHAQRMKAKHPKWSDRQARCVLYWQNTVRKSLRIAINSFTWQHPGTTSTLLPEAMGVNVIATAKKVGIDIEVKPEKIVAKIALVGFPNGGAQ